MLIQYGKLALASTEHVNVKSESEIILEIHSRAGLVSKMGFD